MYIAKAAAVLAAALFCLASPAAANGLTHNTPKTTRNQKSEYGGIKLGTGRVWFGGQIVPFD